MNIYDITIYDISGGVIFEQRYMRCTLLNVIKMVEKQFETPIRDFVHYRIEHYSQMYYVSDYTIMSRDEDGGDRVVVTCRDFRDAKRGAKVLNNIINENPIAEKDEKGES